MWSAGFEMCGAAKWDIHIFNYHPRHIAPQTISDGVTNLQFTLPPHITISSCHLTNCALQLLTWNTYS